MGCFSSGPEPSQPCQIDEPSQIDDKNPHWPRNCFQEMVDTVDTETSAALPWMPDELWKLIAERLRVEDILAWRQTSRQLSRTSWDRFQETHIASRRILIHSQQSFSKALRVVQHPSKGPKIKKLVIDINRMPTPHVGSSHRGNDSTTRPTISSPVLLLCPERAERLLLLVFATLRQYGTVHEIEIVNGLDDNPSWARLVSASGRFAGFRETPFGVEVEGFEMVIEALKKTDLKTVQAFYINTAQGVSFNPGSDLSYLRPSAAFSRLKSLSIRMQPLVYVPPFCPYDRLASRIARDLADLPQLESLSITMTSSLSGRDSRYVEALDVLMFGHLMLRIFPKLESLHAESLHVNIEAFQQFVRNNPRLCTASFRRCHLVCGHGIESALATIKHEMGLQAVKMDDCMEARYVES